MKPAPFDYVRPDTVAGAVAALSTYGSEAKVLAGGQSLIPMMNFRLLRPSVLIDVGRIGELDGIGREGCSVRIGALTTHRAVEKASDLMACGLVGDALPLIGHVAIRNVGTVGGSLAHADPAAEWPVISLLLEGSFEAVGQGRSRTIPAGEFFTDWMTTALVETELLTAINLTLPPAGAGSALVEVARRQGDFAMAGIGAVVTVDEGVVVDVKLGLLGLGLIPARCRTAEDILRGRVLDDAALDEAADVVYDLVEPLDDQHATADYKRHVARVLTRRALQRALSRTGGSA